MLLEWLYQLIRNARIDNRLTVGLVFIFKRMNFAGKSQSSPDLICSINDNIPILNSHFLRSRRRIRHIDHRDGIELPLPALWRGLYRDHFNTVGRARRDV